MNEARMELGRIRAMAQLDESELTTLKHVLRVSSYPPQSVLIQQGELECDVYFLCQGHVNVTRQTPEGEVFLTMLSPGDYFGEAAIFEEVARTAMVRSVSDVVVLAMSRDDFQALSSKSPGTASKILCGMFREHLGRLRATSEEMLTRRSFLSRFD